MAVLSYKANCGILKSRHIQQFMTKLDWNKVTVWFGKNWLSFSCFTWGKKLREDLYSSIHIEVNSSLLCWALFKGKNIKTKRNRKNIGISLIPICYLPFKIIGAIPLEYRDCHIADTTPFQVCVVSVIRTSCMKEVPYGTFDPLKKSTSAATHRSFGKSNSVVSTFFQ